MWDCTSPLAILQKKANLRRNDGDFSHRNVFRYSGGKGNGRPYALAESQYFQVNLMTPGESSPTVHANLECLKVSNKISFFEPDGGNYTHSLFSRFINNGSNIPIDSCKPKNPTTAGIPYDLMSIYRWMSEVSVSGLKQQLNPTLIENKKPCEWSLFGDINPTNYCSLGRAGNPASNNLTSGSADYIEITKYMDSSPSQRMAVVANADMTSLSSDPFLKNLQMTEANGFDAKTTHSRFHGDYYVNNLAAHSHIYKECKYKNEDDQLYLEQKSQQNEFAVADKAEIEVCSTTNNKAHYGLAKQEHAFAGALAGIFVSLCLHPVDTVKTVIQSCHADQRSINFIGRSIISERGVTGLYRGIASNITSSAPISAIYTFTYESVKGVLLPFLPKVYIGYDQIILNDFLSTSLLLEHQSFAHCMAGGCASIATSFVFTPSERIKQQMQVGSHYQNCWTALVGIIRKGGLPSLYTGWGAVLCRNVPHSIIKFYTYESLKQLMLSSPKPNAQPNTLQTLLCGGLAGSTAALFTTPFDVVKTRLQTQIPGSIHHYEGVFNTLIKIGKHEGLKGLYRGLTPRLVMYISQGAIFFASYESFKRLLSQEMPQIYAHTIGYLQSMEDEAP